MKDRLRQTIHEYVLNHYSDEELEAFAFQHFPLVFREFTQSMTFGRKVRVLLDFCRRHNEMSRLLETLEIDRPDQFWKYLIPTQTDNLDVRRKAVLLFASQTGFQVADLSKVVDIPYIS